MARISLFVELDLLLIILNEETDLLKSDSEFFTFFATNFDCRTIFVNIYLHMLAHSMYLAYVHYLMPNHYLVTLN